MLNNREVLEALLAGETLVDLYDKEMTLRFDGDSLVNQYSVRFPSISLLDWKGKPRTININGYEIPEPMRVKPKHGEPYYIVCLTDSKIHSFNFTDTTSEDRWFSQGLLHESKKAAELHLEALLSFTKHE